MGNGRFASQFDGSPATFPPQAFYYDEQPTMSNEEFDNLEEELVWAGSRVAVLRCGTATASVHTAAAFIVLKQQAVVGATREAARIEALVCCARCHSELFSIAC